MPQTALIIGGGIAGLSTAWALRRRGWVVDLFEQGPLPNPRASSYDEHRITRHSYGHMEGYAWLMPSAFRAWDRLWAEFGVAHYEPTGAVYVLRQETGWYDATARALDSMHIGYETIPLDEAARRFPMVNIEGVLRVVRTEGAGMLFPARILIDLVVLLARLGATLHACTRVEQVDLERGAIVASGREYRGDAVIVAAGAWADRLLPGLRAEATPSRQAVLYLAPPPDLADAWDSAPVLLDHGGDIGIYTLPPRRGTRLKIGDHHFSRTGDPDDDRLATARDLERLIPAARIAYRDFGRYSVLEPKACYYTVTGDERFIVRPEGAAGWLVSACSGHGFKLGPLIGQGVAEAIAGERPAHQLEDWAAGRLLPEPASA